MKESSTKENISTVVLGKRGIVYEKREDFHTSLFNKIYERAFSLTCHSVETQIREKRQEGMHEQLDNIITFVGRRGVGKSSAMLSFMESLKGNADDRNQKDDFYKITEGKQAVQFIGLEWIDASLIERGEDIFEMILAEMLSEFLAWDRKNQNAGTELEYEARELHQMFDNIYRKVLNLKKRSVASGDSYYSNESAISSLRELARSNELRKDFENLIQKYIRVRQMGADESVHYSGTKTFLVVAIDDVDMNVDSGFDILETIQRYLKVYGLIVLLAVNYEQLLICCEKHFSKIYGDYTGYAANEKNQHVAKIAEEYMEKAIPSYMRVYLPSLKKKDYDRDRLTRVKLEIDGKSEDVSIKKAIFGIVERKTKVRYDSQGKKRHFMEPGSLRSLNNQYLFLQGMTEPDSEENFIDRLNFNYRRSMDDLLFRYAFENLPLKERRFFTELSEEDIRRRGEIIVSRFLVGLGGKTEGELHFARAIGEKERDKSTSGTYVHEFQEEYRIYGYSYGELMRSFYFLGREQIYDKKLVHALLAMYSLVLTKIFYNYRRRELALGIPEGKNYEMLKELFGGSAAGSWALYLTPKLKVESAEHGSVFSGAAKGVSMSGKSLSISKDARTKLVKLQEEVEKCKPFKTYERAKFRKIVDLLTGLIGAMTPQLVILLFLSEFHGGSFSINTYILEYNKKRLGITVEKEAEKDNLLTNDTQAEELSFGNCTADYNVLNFINNIFAFEEMADNLILAIMQMLQKGKAEDKRLPQNVLRDLTDDVKERLCQTNGFYKEMHEWTQKHGGMVVPAYSTDIYYNMLKRLARKCQRQAAADMEEDRLFDYLLGLLADIREHLEKSDKYYSDDEKDYIYTAAFDECPVIKRLQVKENNSIKNLYNTFIASVIKSQDNKNERLRPFEDLGSTLY